VVEVLVLADTHVKDDGARKLPERVWAMVRAADAVIHAGDVLSAEFLDRLEATTPTYAVLGNNDAGLVDRLPETLELTLGGVPIGVIHDSGPKVGRARRLHRRFPAAQLVVFGHSHIPYDEEGLGGQRLLNPGSATTRRRQPHHTVARLSLLDGRIDRHELVVVDEPASG
jgi:putative phosphoesterase